MNRNSLLGLIGTLILVFSAAFYLGRLTRLPRPAPYAALPAATPSSYLPEAAALPEPTPEDLRALAETEPEEERAARSSQYRTTQAALPKPTALRTPISKKVSRATPQPQPTAATDPATTKDTAVQTLPADSIDPKNVVAKDDVAIAKRQNYATHLPKEFSAQGVEANVTVVGKLAEVIILSSTSFDERSKDTVIKQVCIDLKKLGFKRVHITDGGDYTMHFGL